MDYSAGHGVVFHWIHDSIMLGRLLPIEHYRNQRPKIFKDIYLEFDYSHVDDVEDEKFWEELKTASSGEGAIMNQNSKAIDPSKRFSVRQFVPTERIGSRFEFVSPYWIFRLINEGTFDAPHHPLDFPCPIDPIKTTENDPPPLITLTEYSQAEREPLIAMIGLSGAVYSADLTKSGTHLICDDPDNKGSAKIKWAKEWNIKIRSSDWLKRCYLGWSWLD